MCAYRLILVLVFVQVIKDYKLIMAVMLLVCAGDQSLQADHGDYVVCCPCR